MPLVEPWREAGLAIYTGLPGDGKSYSAAQMIVQWLETGNPVLSNIEILKLPYKLFGGHKKYGEFHLLHDSDFINFRKLLDEHGNQKYYTYINEKGQEVSEPELELDLMRRLREVLEKNPGKHPLVVIDEAPNYYGAQDWKGNPKAMKAFLRQHRHIGASVIAVAQHEGMLDNTFRMLAQEFRRHKNMCKDSYFQFVLFWFGDNIHCAYSRGNNGGKPDTKQIFDREIFVIRKKKAEVYSTTQMHKTALPGARIKPKKLWKRWVILFIMLGSFAGLGSALLAYFADPDEVQAVADKPDQGVKVNKELVYLEGIEANADLTRMVMFCVDKTGQSFTRRLAYDEQLFWEMHEAIGAEIEIIQRQKPVPFLSSIVNNSQDK